MNVTIQDVARRARVSASTVSLVLNGKGSLSGRTRQRVESAIRDLGYRPRAVGRRARRGRETGRTIAVVCPASHTSGKRHRSGTYRDWLRGLRRVLIEYGCHVGLFSGAVNIDDDLMLREMIDDGEIAGAILMGIGESDGYLQHLQAAGLPVVVINRSPRHNEFSSVAINNVDGGGLAAGHLIDLDHRRLAVATLPGDRGPHADRAAGFLARAQRAGLSEPSMDHVELNADERTLIRLLQKLQRERRTGVFTYNDRLAVRIIDAMATADLRCPRDLSVVGFDDSPITSAGGLRPTSIGYDAVSMGAAAGRMAVRLVDEKPHLLALNETFRCRLIQHDTTDSPPQGSLP